jgi:hypothetical protein
VDGKALSPTGVTVSGMTTELRFVLPRNALSAIAVTVYVVKPLTTVPGITTAGFESDGALVTVTLVPVEMVYFSPSMVKAPDGNAEAGPAEARESARVKLRARIAAPRRLTGVTFRGDDNMRSDLVSDL